MLQRPWKSGHNKAFFLTRKS